MIEKNSIESSNQNEISIHTSNLNDMSQILRKINYVNKDKFLQAGSRAIHLTTNVK